jgi:hypothetical protein
MIGAAVLTSIMDDYDTLKPVLPQDGADVHWVCFTDSTQLRDEAVRGPVVRPDGFYVEGVLTHPTGWEIIYYNRPGGEHPNRAAKLPKVVPGFFTHAGASVWVDASFRIVSPRLVVDTLSAAETTGIAQFRHPWRDCLYDEVEASMALPKYADEVPRLVQQRDGYNYVGMPRHWGLWATGVIARHHTRPVLDWGQLWGTEINAHSYQDQISHPYALWRSDLRPADLPGTHLGNAWLAYEGSGRH